MRVVVKLCVLFPTITLRLFGDEFILWRHLQWHQANPHQFHLLTLGTLHSLPSPVARRSQKFFKPEFFEVLKRERVGMDAVRDARRWLCNVGLGSGVDLGMGDGEVGGWSQVEIVIELGGVLKARDRVISSSRGKVFT
jgi:cell cycle checkpoint protein